MTPKEKAKELVEKFYFNVLDRDGTAAMNGFEVKQCALIAVDEIIKNIINTPTDYGASWTYWEQVKIEIEKL
jgi:hypothetical protein